MIHTTERLSLMLLYVTRQLEELPYCTQSLTGSGTRRVVADNIERDAAAVNLHEVVLADRSKNLIR